MGLSETTFMIGPPKVTYNPTPLTLYFIYLKYSKPNSKQFFLIISAIQAKGDLAKDQLEGKTLTVRPVGSPQFCVDWRTRVKSWSTVENSKTFFH